MAKEQSFQEKVKKFIYSCGGECYVHTPAMYDGKAFGEVGVADIVGCLPGGYFVALEVKGSKGSPTKEVQRNFLVKYRKLTHLTFVVYPENFEEVQQIILSTIAGIPIRRTISIRDFKPAITNESHTAPAHRVWQHLREL